MDLIIGIGGLLLGVISLGYAIYMNREMRKLKAHQIDNLRTTLKDSIVVMSQTDRLLKNANQYQITDPEAVSRISSAHSNSVDVIRSLFRDLSKIDLPYDNSKLNGYVKAGLITSNWVWEQALTYADDPNSFRKPELLDDSPDHMNTRKA